MITNNDDTLELCTIYGTLTLSGIHAIIINKILSWDTFANLRYISQNGPANHYPVHGTIPRTSRYEHSIGCFCLTMLLYKRSPYIEECADDFAKTHGTPFRYACAALLHDVMHTAFSHTVDFMWKRKQNVSYHDQIKKAFLERHAIFLESIFGPCWQQIFDDNINKIIKKNNPCAIDSLDYTIRDSIAYNLIRFEEIKPHLDLLSVISDSICCESVDEQKWWENISKRLTDEIYLSPCNAGANVALATALENIILAHRGTENELMIPNNDTEQKYFEMCKNDFINMYEPAAKWHFKPHIATSDTTPSVTNSKNYVIHLRPRYISPPLSSDPHKDTYTLPTSIIVNDLMHDTHSIYNN